MRLLALDSASERLSLALGDGRRIWAWQGTGAHDEILLPSIERLLKKARWKRGEIEALAVASGPGRFTGIRIGMTAASILSKALGVPAVAVTRFEALAGRLGRETGLVCVILPARMDKGGEFCAQTFAGKGSGLVPRTEPSWVQAAQLSAWWRGQPRGARLYGPAAREAASILGAPAEQSGEPAAADLLVPALERLRSGRLGVFAPLYLKPANFQKTA